MAWSCPWYVAIMLFGTMTVTSSLLNGPPLVDVLALIAVAAMGYLTALRQTGSCER